ncbi:uncharacterized protein LOC115750848 isoform X1 [Rhodamnia argentea]|uniref:Uncharacterized protein LOC115750848 n=1 Tax=Rhodamnia argentea TaxID=178133 RepID=A0A8B8QB22_9MYRT|nr:uncharacterized protein LOC115750848 isoform X1 [Rhodamnia argentea]XP_048135124.1 uncharacterized protein LOC115750848 isoform X1 [Rhodamnia argentea]XP_048135125.1 uncharacterized protein LOC115750848 isoform X1 [Rhodamnia argentea]
MDKQEDKEISVPSASESAVSSGQDGISGGGKETLAGARDCGGQGQREGSLAVETVAEEVAFSNGDDIMVEVMGSEVFVDGVCSPGDEENLKAEGGRDASASGSRGLERDAKSLRDGVSGGEPSGFGVKGGVGGSPGTESRKEGGERCTEAVESKVEDPASGEVGTFNDEARDAGMDPRIEHASDIVGDGDRETQMIEETQIIEEMEFIGQTQIIEGAAAVLEERLVEKGADQPSDVVQDTVTANKTGDSVDIVGSMHVQAPIAGEKVIGSDAEVQTEEGVKSGEGAAVEVASAQDTHAQETVCPSATVKSSSSPTSVLEEKGTAMIGGEKVITEDKMPPTSGLEAVTSVSEGEHILEMETACGGKVEVKENLAKVNAECEDKQTTVTVESEDKAITQDLSNLEVEGTARYISDENLVNTDGGLVENIEVKAIEANAEESHMVVEDQLGRDENTMAAAESIGASTTLGLQDQVISESKAAGAESEVFPHMIPENSTSVGMDTTGNDQSLAVNAVPMFTEGEAHVTESRENKSKDNELALDQTMDVMELVEDNQPCSNEDAAPDVTRSNVEDTEVGEQASNADATGLTNINEMEIDNQPTDNEKQMEVEETTIEHGDSKPASLVGVNQAVYKLPSENENILSVSDLVWGKVRSHPWWPGQIFDPSDASEKAMKYHKKDCFLVAYFGDRTFAWNEASLLKPFQAHFSQIAMQSNSESFLHAVNCALDEVSRRVELGLACSCIPKDVYDKIKVQTVENTGIREELGSREGVDESTSASSFEPDKLLEYMKTLARCSSSGGDRLDLVIAKAQLLAFYRQKGYDELPELQFCEGLTESDAEALNSDGDNHVANNVESGTLVSEDTMVFSRRDGLKALKGSSHRRKHNLKDIADYKKKERSLAELMDDSMDYPDEETDLDGKASGMLVSPSSGKKRKARDPSADSNLSDGRKNICVAKVVSAASIPKPSFKIGECIRRVASQLTGSPIVKSDRNGAGDGSETADTEKGRTIIPTEYSSLDGLLSQLYSAALDPMQEFSFLNVLICFFSDFRNSVASGPDPALGRLSAKRKKSETFEFEDMNDSYWTDRVIGNGFEEQPSDADWKGDDQLVAVESQKVRKVGRRSYTRRRDLDESNLLVEKPPGYVDENAPAELVLMFPLSASAPSEYSLNKMFKRFGPLKESETELDRDTNRARLVFKKCSDAEVAFNSAQKFNIFGAMLVNYQLNYSVSSLVKTSPIPMLELEGFEAC